MQFRKKELKPTKRVCLRLKETREEHGVSLEEMAKKLRMSTKHVEALESCQFDLLPFSAVYQKKLIKSYLQMVGVDAQAFVQQFVYEEVKSHAPLAEEPSSAQYLRLPNLPFFFRIVAIGAILLAIGLYLFLQIKHIVDPPALLVFSPEQDMTTPDGHIIAKGKTDREAKIQINGKQIMNSEEGFFEEDITLAEGVNTIIFTARKKHGKETTKVRHVVYRKDQVLTAAPQIHIIQ